MKRFVYLFLIGGFGYNRLERLWRGYSHWSMFFLGGFCFHLIGYIAALLRHRSCLVRAAACSAAVTAAEFLSGCLLNLRWKLGVWDYSRVIGNIRGQICLPYSILWGALSVLVAPLYRLLNRQLLKDSNR